MPTKEEKFLQKCEELHSTRYDFEQFVVTKYGNSGCAGLAISVEFDGERMLRVHKQMCHKMLTYYDFNESGLKYWSAIVELAWQVWCESKRISDDYTYEQSLGYDI